MSVTIPQIRAALGNQSINPCAGLVGVVAAHLALNRVALGIGGKRRVIGLAVFQCLTHRKGQMGFVLTRMSQCGELGLHACQLGIIKSEGFQIRQAPVGFAR